MEAFKLGYYRRDTGDGYVCHYHMSGEPPDGQYVLRDGKWKPLVDGFALADRLITGEVDYDFAGESPPDGVAPIEPRQMSPT